MSLLPTAHAGQSFGSRRIDFITVSGEVSNSDAGTGRVTDGDGVVHDIRLIERTSALAAGDTATVLRVQSGPSRRSRPVAIINHSRNVWMRAAPDATSILARSGVTRTLNWWLSVLALALVAVAAAWPALHSFLTEVNGAMMTGVPAFDLYAELGARMPGLASWRLETALPSGLFDGIAALGVVPMNQLTEWGLVTGVAILALVTFFARSWRLLYVPALALLCVVSGAILSSPVATLLMIGGSVLLFVIGGFINRVRDGGRFNARVERLAEYVLSHPPEEGVRSSETARAASIAPEPLAAAVAATAIATASAVAEGDEPAAEAGDDAEPEAVAADEIDPADAEATDTDTAGSAANGEVAADENGDDETAASAEIETATDAETSSDVEAEVEPVAAVSAEPAAEESDEALDDAEPAADAAPEAEAEAGTDADAEAGDQSADAADSDIESEDDLPSLEAVAAAAAISDSERAGLSAEADAGTASLLDDDRTMAVAAPPPMPAPPAETEAPASADPEPATPELMAATPAAEALAPMPAGEMGDTPADEPAGIINASPAPQDVAAEAESGEVSAEAADDAEASVTAAAIEDPMIDDDHDPMMESASGDFAPGAPEVEVDPDKAG
ncbi:hypothetical protein [Maricaulis sp.]|uniref:hypothetical protein n=1 Tax=Maricaulis sp. TaxID=1486257 RepID=UPI003A90F795